LSSLFKARVEGVTAMFDFHGWEGTGEP